MVKLAERFGASEPSLLAALVGGLSARDLETRIVGLARDTDFGHRAMAFYLADMYARDVHQLLGFATTTQFAEQRLEMSRRTAQELLAVGRALEELPRIDAAFGAGQIRWARVRLLARVAQPAVEEAWLNAALTLSWRDFERAVATSEPGRAPRDDGLGLPVIKVAVRARVPAADYERIELARRKLADERGMPVDEAEYLTLAADMILGSRPAKQAEGREPVDESLYRVAVTQCRTCRGATMTTADGPLALSEAEAARIACDAETHTDGHEHNTDEPAPKTPPALRRHVLVRDGGRCRSCRATGSLNVHHIVWRSEGGPSQASNLLCLCGRCHALVHERLLIIEGASADEAVFVDRDHRPLVRPTSSPEAMTEASGLPVAAPPKLQPSTASARVTFDALPGVVDAGWFARHAHLFRWNERRNELSFEPGTEAPATEIEIVAAARLPEFVDPSRPQSLAALVGQDDVKAMLLPAVKAANRRGQALDHALFFGPPGTGKSTVARLMATALGTSAKTVNGPNISDPATLLRLLVSLRPRDVFFIDEVHAANRKVIESLYEALEEGRVSLAVGDGHRSKPLSIALSPFTLVGATTEAGVLPEAFESRFGLRASFAPFTAEELSLIVTRAVARAGVRIVADAALELAIAARGSAREALALVRRALDVPVGSASDDPDAPPCIDLCAAKAALRALTIDDDGLRAVERRALVALQTVAHGRPMGLARWAAAAGLPHETLRRICEPELLRAGFIDVGPRGRFALSARRKN